MPDEQSPETMEVVLEGGRTEIRRIDHYEREPHRVGPMVNVAVPVLFRGEELHWFIDNNGHHRAMIIKTQYHPPIIDSYNKPFNPWER